MSNSIEASFLAWYKRLNVVPSYPQRVASLHDTYQIAWNKINKNSEKLIMYALSHHVQSFDESITMNIKSLRLQTITKRLIIDIVVDRWIFIERNLLTNIDFASRNLSRESVIKILAEACQIINEMTNLKVRQDMKAQINLDSMYFSEKALSKFATLLYIIHDFARQSNLTREGINKTNLSNTFETKSVSISDFNWCSLKSRIIYLTTKAFVYYCKYKASNPLFFSFASIHSFSTI